MDKKEYSEAKAYNSWKNGKPKNVKKVVHKGITYPSIRKFAWEVLKKEARYVYGKIQRGDFNLPDGSVFEIID